MVAPSAMDVSPTAKIKINPIMPAVLRTDELLTTAAFRGELERVREMLDHGAVCDDDPRGFVIAASQAIMGFIKQDPGSIEFSLMALCHVGE